MRRIYEYCKYIIIKTRYRDSLKVSILDESVTDSNLSPYSVVDASSPSVKLIPWTQGGVYHRNEQTEKQEQMDIHILNIHVPDVDLSYLQ